MSSSVFCDYRCQPPPGSSKEIVKEDPKSSSEGGAGVKAFGFCNTARVLAVGEGGGVRFYGEEVSLD